MVLVRRLIDCSIDLRMEAQSSPAIDPFASDADFAATPTLPRAVIALIIVIGAVAPKVKAVTIADVTVAIAEAVENAKAASALPQPPRASNASSVLCAMRSMSSRAFFHIA